MANSGGWIKLNGLIGTSSAIRSIPLKFDEIFVSNDGSFILYQMEIHPKLDKLEIIEPNCVVTKSKIGLTLQNFGHFQVKSAVKPIHLNERTKPTKNWQQVNQNEFKPSQKLVQHPKILVISELKVL